MSSHSVSSGSLRCHCQPSTGTLMWPSSSVSRATSAVPTKGADVSPCSTDDPTSSALETVPVPGNSVVRAGLGFSACPMASLG